MTEATGGPPGATTPLHTNRLAGETSPYLLQHAHNPVDWWPWNGDALARAKLLDRPIFLSIGYAACHWCHVMERESFEDEATAAYLNAHFIPIKVDREERPDLDQVYMSAVQAMTGSGGWPMSVFLTPDGRPFYGGTYFPDEPRHGMPSFRQVLEGVHQAWTDQRAEVLQAGARMVDALVRQQALPSVGPPPTPAVLAEAAAALETSFDARNGGWGSAPKFPQPMAIEFLLRQHVATGAQEPLAIARWTLDRMAAGGIRDQLGGGFHRYATDAVWLVPHFEQMLYDNAQLARVYLQAWALTGDPRYRTVGEGTLEYMARELRTADGGFAASQDADTDGVEGATFTWRADEIREALGPNAAEFMAAYGVTDEGNWEGVTILSLVVPPTDPAVAARLAAARATLLERRSSRPQPARDDKVLAAWNGLAIGAFAEAARLLGGRDDEEDRRAAERWASLAADAADAVLGGLYRDGRLGRSWKDGRATGQGVLEDYADLADGLLTLYEATFDERWFVVGRELAETILARFVDPAGGFFDVADDHETLVARPKDVQDNATPSGGSTATRALLRLSALTGDGRYRSAAERAIAGVTPFVARYPTGFANWLSAIDFALAPVAEVAIVGDPGGATEALVAVVRDGFRPNQVVALTADPATSAIPLLHDRAPIDGRSTAYVCRAFACRLPVTEPAALSAQLAEVAAPASS